MTLKSYRILCFGIKFLNNQFFVLIALVLSVVTANAQRVDETTVESLVKTAPCMDQTIEAMLTNKIKTGSQRDLGWQVFKEEDRFEVEHAFLLTKACNCAFAGASKAMAAPQQ